MKTLTRGLLVLLCSLVFCSTGDAKKPQTPMWLGFPRHTSLPMNSDKKTLHFVVQYPGMRGINCGFVLSYKDSGKSPAELQRNITAHLQFRQRDDKSILKPVFHNKQIQYSFVRPRRFMYLRMELVAPKHGSVNEALKAAFGKKTAAKLTLTAKPCKDLHLPKPSPTTKPAKRAPAKR